MISYSHQHNTPIECVQTGADTVPSNPHLFSVFTCEGISEPSPGPICWNDSRDECWFRISFPVFVLSYLTRTQEVYWPFCACCCSVMWPLSELEGWWPAQVYGNTHRHSRETSHGTYSVCFWWGEWWRGREREKMDEGCWKKREIFS